MAAENSITTCVFGNPEDVFVLPEEANGAKRDIAQTCISRAQATIELVIAGDNSDGFAFGHGLIMDALGAAAGWLKMAQTALSGPVKTDGV